MRARFEKVTPNRDRSFFIEERRMARFDAPWHFHPEIELTLILESRGRRFVGDRIEPFREGDLVLVGPHLPHFWHNEGRQPPGSRAHSVVVQFPSDLLETELGGQPEFAAVRRLLERSSRGLVFTGRAAAAATARLRRLPRLRGLSALLELLGILDVLATSRSARPLSSAAYAPDLDRSSEARLARVYAYLMRRFADDVALADVARIAAMTPEAFSRYFKRATGRNLIDFITELRIDYAGRLLRDTDQKVGAIGVAAGFPTISNFHRRFRAATGRTPLAFRRAYHADAAVPDRFSSSE